MDSCFSRRIIALSLILAILIPVTSCATRTNNPNGAENSNTGTETDEKTEALDTRFLNVDFDGRDFRVQTSINIDDATNANKFIQGPEVQNADIVDDAVYDRNQKVKELLGINLKFTESNYTYDNAAAQIRKIVMTGDDEFDLIINDLRAMAALGIEGLLHDISKIENFDYSKKYWYNDYMQDLQILPGYYYCMAGDYFMDVIASCHALFYNKTLINDSYGDPDYIYKLVLDGKWTYDEMLNITTEGYRDLNGDSKRNKGDQFGFAINGTWGTAIPFIGSSGNTFIDRSSGVPEFALNNERSITFADALLQLWYDKGTFNLPVNGQMNVELLKYFADSKTIIVGYQRLGDLEKMRDIDGFNIGIIPYPKLNETDKYITSTHDTTEIGVMPITAADINFATTVIEVMNRETAAMVIPNYYETALKVKYTTDQLSASMIDIIHDNFGSTFPLAFSDSLNQILLQTYSNCLDKKSNVFASVYESKIKSATALLNKMIEKQQKNIDLLEGTKK